MPTTGRSDFARTRALRLLLIDLALVAAVLVIYAQTQGFEFAKVDDTQYVTSNPHVLGGISAASAAWAFRSFEASNWHPLTWLSLMLDATIGGAQPRVFHVTNVLLHAVNALLLFHLLFAATRSMMKSAFVAALFAVHPLHVESVAWVTERKDVLSTLFWLLSIAAYGWYARRPTAWRYAAVTAAFLLGAMSKPMVVTLPLTLLLLDFWPLGRLVPPYSGALRGWTPITEKLPLLVVSAASCAVTLVAQSDATTPLTTETLGPRLVAALVAYATYAAKMVWPTGLSIHYVLVQPIPAWTVVASAAFLAGATWLAVVLRRLRPYLAFGWLWYLVTLAPVIGIVQVGEQSLADRYTYVPLIGLFVVVAWGVPDLLNALAPPAFPERRLLGVVAMCALVGLTVRAYDQARYWRNAFALFEHAVAVNGQNALARMGFGQELAAQGRDAEAIDQFRVALRLRPSALFAHRQLAQSLARSGLMSEAEGEFREMLRIDPGNAAAGLDLGVLLMEEQKPAEAAGVLQNAAGSNPQDARIHATLGLALTRSGKLADAEAAFDAALRIDPANVLAHNGLAVVLGTTGRPDDAIAHLRLVLEADPNQAEARANLARLLVRQGRTEEARAVMAGRR